MKKGLIGLTIGFVIGLAVILLSAFVCIELGCVPVATSSAPLPLEKWAASTALNAKLRREAPKQSPIQANETNLVAGAEVYRGNCAMCHGTRSQGTTSFARGMFPPPPQFFHGEGVTDDPVGYTYWKVANGIRLTGMPAFRPSLSKLQMWQVSQMLANANNLPSGATNILTPSAPIH
jgi:thiosulfate dehydrogenase